MFPASGTSESGEFSGYTVAAQSLSFTALPHPNNLLTPYNTHLSSVFQLFFLGKGSGTPAGASPVTQW